VLSIVIAFDFSFGIVSNYYVRNYQLPGDYQPIDYVIKESEDSILILGSSVALNSLMPSVIEDSLELTCFNGGANAQNLIFYKTMLDCVLKRYTPKMIILGMRPNELENGNMGRYSFLAPYYHTGYVLIDSCLESKSRNQKYLMQSNLFRYNTIWFRILLYHFITPDERGDKGFIAKSKPITPTVMTESKGSGKISQVRKEELIYIIRRCKEHNIRLIVYFPPMFTHLTGNLQTVDVVRELCTENDIACYFDAQDSTFLAHNEWFHDNAHLDKDGARVYSELFVSRIRKELKK
jgi:hypothetical protein